AGIRRPLRGDERKRRLGAVLCEYGRRPGPELPALQRRGRRGIRIVVRAVGTALRTARTDERGDRDFAGVLLPVRLLPDGRNPAVQQSGGGLRQGQAASSIRRGGRVRGGGDRGPLFLHGPER